MIVYSRLLSEVCTSLRDRIRQRAIGCYRSRTQRAPQETGLCSPFPTHTFGLLLRPYVWSLYDWGPASSASISAAFDSYCQDAIHWEYWLQGYWNIQYGVVLEWSISPPLKWPQNTQQKHKPKKTDHKFSKYCWQTKPLQLLHRPLEVRAWGVSFCENISSQRLLRLPIEKS